jgi:UDP-glucose 4-epimerase
MAEYLVTGGAGFIGSHLVEALVRRGATVRVLDDLSSGHRGNLEPFGDRVELVVGSVADAAALRRATHGIRAVFHQAALASVARSVAEPAATHEVCATGTLQLLIAARDAGVQRVVYAASSSAYGDSEELPNHEDLPPRPLSPYAAAKLVGEHYCEAFTRTYGLETVRLRYFNVFGPRQDPHSPYSAVIPLFIRAMLTGKTPIIYGDGGQSRDFTHIGNVVHANMLAMQAHHVAGRVFNVASGVRTSLLDLIRVLNEILGTRVVPIHEAARPGDVRHSQASIRRAEQELGYAVQVSLDEGLRRTVEYYRACS